jgi:hypothetical protein
MTAKLVGFPKNVTYRNKRIRESARGKECLMRLPGCAGGTESTIWSHYRGGSGGKGLGLKADDLCGAFACVSCDQLYDGQKKRPAHLNFQDVMLAWFEAHIKSIVILHAEGVI